MFLITDSRPSIFSLSSPVISLVSPRVAPILAIATSNSKNVPTDFLTKTPVIAAPNVTAAILAAAIDLPILASEPDIVFPDASDADAAAAKAVCIPLESPPMTAFISTSLAIYSPTFLPLVLSPDLFCKSRPKKHRISWV